MSSSEAGSGGTKQSAGADKEAKDKGHAAAKPKAGAASDKADSKAGGAKPTYTEEALFRDPYGVLSKLAKQATADQSQSAKGGEAYRDPFDPVFRRETQAEKREPAKPAQTSSPVVAPESAPGTPPTAADAKQSFDTQPPPAPVRPAQEPQPEKMKDQDTQAQQAKGQEAQAQQAKDREAQAQKEKEQAAERAAAAAKLERDIREVVARAIAGALPNITVTVTEEGILISLTDDQNFGMFAIASAEPRPAMVVLMEKLGKVLVGYREPLIVRGHTDGRPYKSGTYDNWRLSTARAHMAYYMLVRAGIEEKRFERIEGHADRHLKVLHDPEAAQNRRIEILLRRPTP
jgi:chemotaxis protein MotB